MGGPCFLTTKASGGHRQFKKKQGPACTDNFQVAPFKYKSLEWYSVEQCYQAMKYTNEETIKKLNAEVPRTGESDGAYGMRVWRLGQTGKGKRLGWDTQGLGIRYMFEINWEKYRQNEELQQDLLATGDVILYGAPSTKQWTKWNGLIQQLIRKLLRERVDYYSLENIDLFQELKQFLPEWKTIGLVPEDFSLGFV